MRKSNQIPELVRDETEEERIDRVLREMGIALPEIEADALAREPIATIEEEADAIEVASPTGEYAG